MQTAVLDSNTQMPLEYIHIIHIYIWKIIMPKNGNCKIANFTTVTPLHSNGHPIHTEKKLTCSGYTNI